MQSGEHLALLSQQLAEERQQVAALSADLDSLQAEHNRYKTQVSDLVLMANNPLVTLISGQQLGADHDGKQPWCIGISSQVMPTAQRALCEADRLWLASKASWYGRGVELQVEVG